MLAATAGVTALRGSPARAAAPRTPGVPSTTELLDTQWLVGRSAIDLIDGFWGNDSLSSAAFDRPSVRVTFGLPAGWASQATASFDAVGPVTYRGSFLYDLAHNEIPAGTKAVLLDLEHWSLSPADEARQPGYFMQQFVAKAHLHGYEAIVAPGVDLTLAMSCKQASVPSYLNYLDSCQLPKLVGEARPDIYAIQAQAFENNTSLASGCACYAWFVTQAAAEARKADPGLSVFATLASDPEGRLTTPQVLYADTLHTRPIVAGYSFNIPRRSTACPTCTVSGAPGVAADYLAMLGYRGTGRGSDAQQAYWLAARNGEVFAAGAALPLGGTRTVASDPVAAIAATPDARGYWVVTADGGVTAFGDAAFLGDLPRLGARVSDIVAFVPTADGRGYWLIGRDGGQFAFGDADYLGSLPGLGVHVRNITAMAATPGGRGYWVIARDGGIFAFGNARYLGSLPALGIHSANVVAMVPAGAGTGYVLVGADGGTFVFGSGVRYLGSLPGRGVHVKDVVGLAITKAGGGYWLAGGDGAVYGFGNAQTFRFLSAPGHGSPIVSIAGS